MSKLFTLPKEVILTNAGELIPGAKAYFYVANTATPQSVYTEYTLTTPHSDPVVADGNGRFPTIYLDPTLNYKVKITDASDVEIYTQDYSSVPRPASNISVTDAAGNIDATDVEAAIAEIYTDFNLASTLAAVTNGDGAALVGVEDAAGNLAATTVEAALAEIFTSLADPSKALIFSGTPQSLSGAGAVDVTSAVTHVTTTGVDALTLADGVSGQRKYIVMISDGGDGTLTPTNLGNGTTITFDDAGDSADLLFTNSAWYFMGGTATLA